MELKKKHTLLKFIGMAVCVIVLVALLVKLCNYLLLDDTSRYTRLTMHEFYEAADEGDNIDVIFLGSSHVIHACDPELFTELTGKTSFNLGSSAQNYDTSYYLLREAVKYNDIETVYLDIHYKFLFVGREDHDLVQSNIITDYMRFSLNKLEFILSTSDETDYANRFLPFRRNWQSLGDLSYIKELLQKKSTDEYKEYQYIRDEDEYYAGRGFIYTETTLDASEITWWDNYTDLSEDKVEGETYSLDYVAGIAQLCKDEGIELVFVTIPSFDQYLEEVGPYDPAHEYMQELADSLGVVYLDFNQCNDYYFDPGEEWFMDVDHLNGAGAGAFTELLAKLDILMDEAGGDDGQIGALIDEYFDACYD